jgi:hypothetical protein
MGCCHARAPRAAKQAAARKSNQNEVSRRHAANMEVILGVKLVQLAIYRDAAPPALDPVALWIEEQVVLSSRLEVVVGKMQAFGEFPRTTCSSKHL